MLPELSNQAKRPETDIDATKARKTRS